MTNKEDRLKAWNNYMKMQEEWESTPEYQAAIVAAEERKVEREKMFRKLEEEFADRGLKVLSWGGACPTQGYGYLDGDRWYFRFRWGNATLDVGPYVEEDEEADYQKALKRYHREMAEIESGLRDEESLFAPHVPRKRMPDDEQFYPKNATRKSSKPGPDPQDAYDGTMEDPQECYDYLKSMILDLK